MRDKQDLSCSQQFRECNFGDRNFALLVKMRELPQGGASKAQYYEITKDGFSFLVMGYTGAKGFPKQHPALESFSIYRNDSNQIWLE